MRLMPSNPPAGGHSPAAYLEQLETLRREMQAAMLAISSNQLTILEQSLWKQQVLCTSLKHLSHILASEEMESSLSRRIRESTTALHEVSRTYAALLKQASASGDLLLRLCHSYRDASPLPPPDVAVAPRLLSCEA